MAFCRAGLTPSIQLIDTWFEARRLGLMFEVKVGSGKVLVTSIDFKNDMKNRLAARQLYASVLSYIESEDFDPQIEVDLETIEGLYR